MHYIGFSQSYMRERNIKGVFLMGDYYSDVNIAAHSDSWASLMRSMNGFSKTGSEDAIY